MTNTTLWTSSVRTRSLMPRHACALPLPAVAVTGNAIASGDAAAFGTAVAGGNAAGVYTGSGIGSAAAATTQGSPPRGPR